MNEKTRLIYEEREANQLASYAVCSANTLGRRYPEKEHDYRTCFQRDRDRIVHSEAFRRLEYKTQVFVTGSGDYYRTRLTHTLEVSQIARTLARVLCINEDLTEALALAHDLGHPPFGHTGERVLNKLLGDGLRFEHNAQALRILDCLESHYPDFPGLNLTAELRRGVLKNKKMYEENIEGLANNLSIEAQVVDIADEISYTSHDLDDGISAGFLDPHDILEVTLWRESHETVKERNPEMDQKRTWFQVIIDVINAQVTDVLNEARQRLDANDGSCLDNMVDYSDAMSGKLHEAKDFLFAQLYRHPKVVRASSHCHTVLSRLLEYYHQNADQLPLSFQKRIETDGLSRTVTDYISGMTDRFAQEDYQRLFGF
jgi:dGTPase